MYFVVAETQGVSKVGSRVAMPIGWRAVQYLSMCVLELAVQFDTLEIVVVDVRTSSVRNIGGACKTCGFDIVGDMGSPDVWFNVC